MTKLAAPTRLTKSFVPVETKVLDAAAGIVECVFSVTAALDRQDDIIEPGAFKSAADLAQSKGVLPTVVFGHEWSDIHQILGRTLAWDELAPGDGGLPPTLQKSGFGGMKATIQYDLETPAGQVAFTHVKNGNLREYSFAFDIAEGGSAYDSKAGVRRITKIAEVFEISLVLIGANQHTVQMAYKSFTAQRPVKTWPDASVGRLQMARELASQFTEDHADLRTAAFAGEDEAKTMWLPVLGGAESQHNGPIQDALSAINTLIQQELGEDSPEYDCVIRLACIAQSLVWWAQDESLEYGGPIAIPYDDDPYYYALPASPAADVAAEEKDQPAAVSNVPEWMWVGFKNAMNPGAQTVPADVEPAPEYTGLMQRLLRVRRT